MLYGVTKVDELLLPDGDAGVVTEVSLLVMAEVPIGFVVVQVRSGLVQLLAPEAMVHELDAGVNVPVMRAKDAVTVHGALITPVVKVVPESDPPQPEADAKYPALGVTVRVVVFPWVTVCEAGEIVPLSPADPVTV